MDSSGADSTLKAFRFQRHDRRGNDHQIHGSFLVLDCICIHVHALIIEFPPALVTVEDCHAFDLVAVELALEERLEVIKSLSRSLRGDVVLIPLES